MINAFSSGIFEKSLADNHALREQPLEGFVKCHQANVADDLGPKSGIDQMHYGVIVAAYILIYRRPICGNFRIEWQDLICRVCVSEKVPGRIDERIHRI